MQECLKCLDKNVHLVKVKIKEYNKMPNICYITNTNDISDDILVQAMICSIYIYIYRYVLQTNVCFYNLSKNVDSYKRKVIG